jgi:hypothetical protein
METVLWDRKKYYYKILSITDKKHLYTKPHLVVSQNVNKFYKVLVSKNILSLKRLILQKIFYISWLKRMIGILGF